MLPEHGPLSKRPFKKQAVRPTKQASTLLKIDQNAKTSPLLRIPGEVRELIWRAAIGDRMIHIKHFDQDQLKSLQRPPMHPDSAMVKGAFRHIQCRAIITEHEAYEASKAPSQSVPRGDDPACYVQSCKIRHSNCYSLGDGTRGKQVWACLFEQVDYSIAERDRITMCSLLGVSRQIYQEGYRLFWFTNTFSFDDPHSLGEFLGSLTLSQKRHLTNLHIVRRSYGWTAWEWNYVDSRRNVFSLLQGLKTLHLCIEQRTRPDSFDIQYQLVARRDATFIREICHPWSALRTSPLANVTVIISDWRANLRKYHLLADRCTVAEKNRVAEDIREDLTNEAAVAQAREEMFERRARNKASKIRRKERMMLDSEEFALDSTSEQAVVPSNSEGPKQYQGYAQSQQASGQPAYSPHHQTNGQQIPLAWHDPDDQQVLAVIDNHLDQIATHAPAWRNLDQYQQSHMPFDFSKPGMRELKDSFDRSLDEPSDQPQEEQSHTTQSDFSQRDIRELKDSYDRWLAEPRNQPQEEQSRTTQTDLSKPNMDQTDDSFDRWLAEYIEQHQEHEYEDTFPPKLYVNAREASYSVPVQAQQPDIAQQSSYDTYHPHSVPVQAQQQNIAQQPAYDTYYPHSVPVQAQQQEIARQPAYDTYHPHSHRNNNTQRQRPLDVHYPGAGYSNLLSPSYAGPMNVGQSSAQDHQAPSGHQGAQRHTVGGTATELFHPYPRQPRRHRLLKEADIEPDLPRICEEKAEAEIQAADAESED
ncbi:MAG: hypothetical protein Q9195_003814 [Heterodermia aff. obscurata]